MIQQHIISRLTHMVGEQNVLTSPRALEVYAYDSSPFIHPPDAVVFAENREQVTAVVKLAAEHSVPLVPRGAGTCLSGSAVPWHGGISLVLTKMNRILDIDPVAGTALVEPGVVNLDLQIAVEPYGLMFPPDPASQRAATIGGNIAQCAGGIRGVKFGVMKHHVLGLEVVLPDGEVITTGMLAPERQFAPDFTGIFHGSEGTFGVITKALLRLTPLPEKTMTASAAFTSLDEAGQAVSTIIAQGIVPTTLEILDNTLIKAVDDFLQLGLPRDAEALLLVEVDGFAVELDRQMDTIKKVFAANNARDFKMAASEEERQKLWLARRSGNGALGRIKPAYMVQDVTVPVHKLPEMLRFVAQVAEKYNIVIAQMAHAGDGNLHPHLLYNPDDPEEYRRVEEASREIFMKTLELEGTLTGEHGIGLEKLPYMYYAFSPEDLEFMAIVKKALDPTLYFNRGKVLDL